MFTSAKQPDESVAVVPLRPAEPPLPPPPAIIPAAAPPPAQAAKAEQPPSNITVLPNGDTVEVQNGVKIIRMGGAAKSGSSVQMDIAPPANSNK